MSVSKSRNTWLVLILVGLPLAGLLGYRFYQRAGTASGERPAGGPPQGAFGQNNAGQPMRGGTPQATPGQGGPQRPGGGFTPGGSPVRPVEVAQVERGTLREVISLVGSLKPKEQVEVSPKITGRVEKIYVDVGDQVEAGAVLAELEGEELDQQVRRAEATMAVAEASVGQRRAELDNARADQARSAELQAQGLISLQAHQTAETRVAVVESQLRLAEAQVRQAMADLTELQIRLQQTRILSPLTGWVARRYVHPGALVNPNVPLLTLLQLSTMVAQVNVPERDLTRLRVGNRGSVTIDALAGRIYEGHVARISPLLDPTTRSGLVEIEIPNPNSELKAEMFARIQMNLGTERQALLVPREAVVLRGQTTGVNVLLADRVQFRPIHTGTATEQGVEVLEGLTEGTTVVTRGTQDLKDGDAVAIQERQSSRRAQEDRS